MADKFFTQSNKSLEDRIRYYFVDTQMTTLLVQESYLNVNQNRGGTGAGSTPQQQAAAMARVAVRVQMHR